MFLNKWITMNKLLEKRKLEMLLKLKKDQINLA